MTTRLLLSDLNKIKFQKITGRENMDSIMSTCCITNTLHKWQRNRLISVNDDVTADRSGNDVFWTALIRTVCSHSNEQMLQNWRDCVSHYKLKPRYVRQNGCNNKLQKYNFSTLLNKVGLEAKGFIASSAILLVAPVLKSTFCSHLCFISKPLWLCINAKW